MKVAHQKDASPQSLLCGHARVAALKRAATLVVMSGWLAANAQVFSLDRGIVSGLGGTPGGDLLVLNHFNTGAKPVYIDQISVLWNPISSTVSPTVALYADPNGDGNPSDMVPLRIAPIYIPSHVVVLNNTSLQDYPITPTLVSGSFFVGAFLSDREMSFDPAIGYSSPARAPHESWIVENTVAGGLDLLSPAATSTTLAPLDFYISANHMLRAHYTVVPEPSAGLLGLLGGLFFLGGGRGRLGARAGRRAGDGCQFRMRMLRRACWLLEYGLIGFALTGFALAASPGEAVFKLREVSVFSHSGSDFATGQRGHCQEKPFPEVKAYPKFISSKPVYGSVSFADQKGQPHSAMQFYFAADESRGTGKGYDRLYFDLNRDLDLGNDPVMQPLRQTPDGATLQWSNIRQQVCFDAPREGEGEESEGGEGEA